MTDNQRLKFLMLRLGFKRQVDFANALDVKQGTISDIFREKKGLGVSKAILFKLENLYGINSNWVKTGKGEMLKAGSPQAASAPCSDADKVESLKKLLVEKERLLAAKDETIALLKKC